MSSPGQVQLPSAARQQARDEAQAIMDEIAGVTAVVVATIDGFEIASVMRSDLNASRIAALASSIAAIGEVVSAEARLGRSRSVSVDTEAGLAVIYCVHRSDTSLVINVLARADAIVGQVNYRTAAAARRLSG